MNENKKQKDILKWIVIGLAGFAVIVLIFGAGMFVGGIRARFSYRWAESYHKNFAGPRVGFFGDWRRPPLPRDFIEGHGAFGEIIELNNSTSSEQISFVIKGRGDVEKIIVITKDTIIKKGRESVENGLELEDSVVIIGSPNEQGQIEAKLIRIFNGELKGRPMPPKDFRFLFF